MLEIHHFCGIVAEGVRLADNPDERLDVIEVFQRQRRYVIEANDVGDPVFGVFVT